MLLANPGLKAWAIPLCHFVARPFRPYAVTPIRRYVSLLRRSHFRLLAGEFS